jgi:exonuclease VII large subunit
MAELIGIPIYIVFKLAKFTIEGTIQIGIGSYHLSMKFSEYLKKRRETLEQKKKEIKNNRELDRVNKEIADIHNAEANLDNIIVRKVNEYTVDKPPEPTTPMKNEQSNKRPALKLCTVKIAVVYNNDKQLLQVLPYKVESITSEQDVKNDEDQKLIEQYKQYPETKKYHKLDYNDQLSKMLFTGHKMIFDDSFGTDNLKISRLQKTTRQIAQTELDIFLHLLTFQTPIFY